MWWSRDTEDVLQHYALLPSFGSPASRRHVRKSDFVLKANSGAFTVPADWYDLDKKFGMVTLRWEDASENEIDWDAYADFTWSGTIVDTGNKTPVTDEALTFADADEEFSPFGPEGQVSGTLLDGVVIDADNIGDLAITAQQIENLTITAGQIANATITATQIANATITAAQIANATITATQIANATITAAQIANATITASNIAAATIQGSNIANATIAGGNLVNGTITATQIASGTITANEIANATITGAKIAGATITGANIAGGTITAANIASGTITANEIQALTITASQIANLTITAGQIANATITGAQIANATIAGGNIQAATITGSNLAGGTITGSNIAGSTVTGANIASSTITGGLIANATITGAKIAGATITGSNIAAGTITASNIAASTITSSQLTATAIDSMTITGATIRTAASGARTEMNASNLFGLGFGGIGGTNGATTQWYARASDGKFYFADGNQVLSSNGFQSVVGSSYLSARALRFMTAIDGAEVFRVYGWRDSLEPKQRGYIQVPVAGTDGALLEVKAYGANNVQVDIGTGAGADMSLYQGTFGGVTDFILLRGAGGVFTSAKFMAWTDNTYDIGASGANRFRNLYLSGHAALGTVSYTPNAGTKDNVDIADNASVVNAAPSGNITITGFTGGYEGKILVVVNTSTFTITFSNQDTSSGGNNRIVIGDAANKTITGSGAAMMIYVSSRWRWIAFDA